MEQENHLGSPQPDKAPRTCGNVSPAFPAKKLDAGREAAGALEHAVDTMPPRPRGDLSPRLPAAGLEAHPLGYCGPWTHWDLTPGPLRIQVKPNTLYIENQGGGHYEYFKIGSLVAPYQPSDNEIRERLETFFKPQITKDMIMFLLQNNDKVRAVNEIISISNTVPKGLGERGGIITNHNYGEKYVQLKAATTNWIKRTRQKGGRRKSASKSEMGCGCGLKLSGGRRKTRRSKKTRKTRKVRKTRK